MTPGLRAVAGWIVRYLATGIVLAVVVTVAVAALVGSPRPDPLVLAAAATGLLVGLLAGKHWRDQLRAERDAARELVQVWNGSETREALAEVGPATGEHAAIEAPPITEPRCGRCGSGVAFRDCADCGGRGGYEADGYDGPDAFGWHDCATCAGQGTFPYCTAPAEWCRTNPMPGREATPMSAIEEVSGPGVERYEQDDEEPLCSWCTDTATARIDLPGARDLPSCDDHVTAARLGEVTAATAYPDQPGYGSTYGIRL